MTISTCRYNAGFMWKSCCGYPYIMEEKNNVMNDVFSCKRKPRCFTSIHKMTYMDCIYMLINHHKCAVYYTVALGQLYKGIIVLNND